MGEISQKCIKWLMFGFNFVFWVSLITISRMTGMSDPGTVGTFMLFSLSDFRAGLNYSRRNRTAQLQGVHNLFR